jgi:HEAT repeat protein
MRSTTHPRRTLRPAPLALLLALLAFGAGFSAHAQDEAALIAVLQSTAGAVEKCEAAKQLRLAGTAKSVPALAALLTDERVSQAARSALEGNPAPEAATALREALGKTGGPLKAGVVDSLGWRRDAASVALLVPLLGDPDAALATTASRALGRIGGPDALAALQSAQAKAPPAVRPVVLDALLACAEERLAAGRAAEAQAIYRSLIAEMEPEVVRAAAFAGLIRSAGKDALAVWIASLTAADAAAQQAALREADAFTQPEAARNLATLLPQSPPALHLALLSLLQVRADPATQPAVLAVARGTNAAVRVAALKALGDLGDAGTVKLMAESAAAREPAEQAAAREALTRLRRGDIGAALVAELAAAPPAVQTELARALGARRDAGAVPALVQLARSEQPGARRAALLALGSLADAGELGGLVDLLIESKSPDGRAAIAGVFDAVAGRTSAGQPVDAAALLRGLSAADPDARLAALQAAALFADEQLRTAFRAALKQPDARTRDSAARVLCRARDAALLPDLLEVARATDDPGLRSLALEGAVRLATDDHASLSPAQRAEALGVALAQARRAEDKRQVLAGLARVPLPATLQLAEKAATDPAVRAEAEIAALQIMQQLGGAHLDVIESALQRLAESATNPGVRTDAQALQRKLISPWLCAGPYRQTGKQAQDLFGIPFPPEQGGSDVTWQRAPGATARRANEADLASVVGGDHCVVYLRMRLHAPAAQAVVFALGSDDGLKVWINGELIHANNAVRGLTPDEDKAPGRLRAGWNDVLVKLTQHNAGCGLTLRVLGENGQDAPGVRLNPVGE